MKTSKFNKSNIMKVAHDYYKNYKRQGCETSFGMCLKISWAEEKSRVESEERALKRYEEDKAEVQKRNAFVNAECERLGVDLHTYTMMNYYNRPCGTYYGD